MQTVKVILQKVKAKVHNNKGYDKHYRRCVQDGIKEIKEDRYGYAVRGNRDTLTIFVNNKHDLKGLLTVAENYAIHYKTEGNIEELPQYA